jgi:hypothetical protein
MSFRRWIAHRLDPPDTVARKTSRRAGGAGGTTPADRAALRRLVGPGIALVVLGATATHAAPETLPLVGEMIQWGGALVILGWLIAEWRERRWGVFATRTARWLLLLPLWLVPAQVAAMRGRSPGYTDALRQGVVAAEPPFGCCLFQVLMLLGGIALLFLPYGLLAVAGLVLLVPGTRIGLAAVRHRGGRDAEPPPPRGAGVRRTVRSAALLAAAGGVLLLPPTQLPRMNVAGYLIDHSWCFLRGKEEAPSPDGAYVARLVYVGCGGAAGSSSQAVKLVGTSDLLGLNGRFVATYGSGEGVRLAWTGEHELRIESGSPPWGTPVSEVGDVRIGYGGLRP